MSKKLRIWLGFALVLSMLTTVMNAFYGRWPSVVIALGAMVGLCALLFAKKKWGFSLMCVCYGMAFAVGAWEGIAGATGIVSAIVMSFIGSSLIPAVTYGFLRLEKK